MPFRPITVRIIKLLPHLLASLILSAVPVALTQTQIQFRQVKREVIESRLRRFSESDDKRASTIHQLFTESGCVNHITEQLVRKNLPNIICVLPGQTNDVIVVGGHTDHIWKGQGVVDNWSGASLLPSLYYSLSAEPRNHTYVFIAFTQEEEGLVGSRFYVEHLSQQERERIKAMVNLDTIGLGPTKVWASHADKFLLRDLVVVARTLNLPIAAVNVERVGSTDSESFAVRKIPSIAIHSITQETLSILHTPRDRIEQISLDDYYASYVLIGGYLAYLDHRVGQDQR